MPDWIKRKLESGLQEEIHSNTIIVGVSSISLNKQNNQIEKSIKTKKT